MEEYKACGAKDLDTKYLITDNFFKSFEEFSKNFGLEKSFPIQVKQIRILKNSTVESAYVLKKN